MQKKEVSMERKSEDEPVKEEEPSSETTQLEASGGSRGTSSVDERIIDAGC